MINNMEVVECNIAYFQTYVLHQHGKQKNEPNTLQYIIEHFNITMTLGYYAHGSFTSVKAEMERLPLVVNV